MWGVIRFVRLVPLVCSAEKQKTKQNTAIKHHLWQITLFVEYKQQ